VQPLTFTAMLAAFKPYEKIMAFVKPVGLVHRCAAVGTPDVGCALTPHSRSTYILHTHINPFFHCGILNLLFNVTINSGDILPQPKYDLNREIPTFDTGKFLTYPVNGGVSGCEGVKGAGTVPRSAESGRKCYCMVWVAHETLRCNVSDMERLLSSPFIRLFRKLLHINFYDFTGMGCFDSESL
jgi:hypothetical protein